MSYRLFEFVVTYKASKRTKMSKGKMRQSCLWDHGSLHCDGGVLGLLDVQLLEVVRDPVVHRGARCHSHSPETGPVISLQKVIHHLHSHVHRKKPASRKRISRRYLLRTALKVLTYFWVIAVSASKIPRIAENLWV